MNDQADWLAEAATINGFSEPYLAGDANLDGTVNAMDLNSVGVNWQQNFGAWSRGDFNADNSVNATDLNSLGVNWQDSVAIAVPVPEPAVALMLWPFLAVGLLRRRK